MTPSATKTLGTCFRSRPAGVALLLALLVLAGVITTALTAATLVRREFRASSVSDGSLIAFYAAESAIEQALYQLRLEQADEAALAIAEADPRILQASGARFWRSASFVQDTFVQSLRQDETTQLDLIDPSYVVGDPFKADAVELLWDSDGCTDPGAEWLEVALSGIRTDSQTFEQYRYFYSAASADGVSLTLDPSYLSYRLRATARYADVCSLRVRVMNGADVVPLPARVTITGTAELRGVRQSLSVSVPRISSQASAFDFVLFSQESICKDVDPAECL